METSFMLLLALKRSTMTYLPVDGLHCLGKKLCYNVHTLEAFEGFFVLETNSTTLNFRLGFLFLFFFA